MPLPQPEVIRERAAEILQRSDYQLQPVGENRATLRDILMKILEWILTPFQILFDFLDNISPVLAWIVTGGLLLIPILLIVYFVKSFRGAFSRPGRDRSYQSERTMEEVDPETLERSATKEAASGDFILAIRLLLRAVLLRLAARDGKRFAPGMTNREYLCHYRETNLFQPLLVLVDAVDTKWYGTSLCGMEDYRDCQNAHRQMVQHIQEPAECSTRAM
ncbi:MAG: DUF4129 domain-containing protein [Pirellulales bacterium]|nr:DUF4129 domain-containing protein [Pirellulales bacterium]